MRFPCKVLSFCHLFPANSFFSRSQEMSSLFTWLGVMRATAGHKMVGGGWELCSIRPPACLVVKTTKGLSWSFCKGLQTVLDYMICPISKVYYVCVWCTVGCYCIAVCSMEMRARGVVQVFGQRATLASTATQPSLILIPTRIWTICSRLFFCYFRLEVFRLPSTNTAERDHNTISVQQKTQPKKILLQASILDVGYCQIITATQTTHTTYSPYSHSIPMSQNIVVFIFERLCSQ